MKTTTEAHKKALNSLISIGKEQGYLTYSEINDLLPDDLLTPEQVEPIVTILEELDINIVEKIPILDLRAISLKTFVKNYDVPIRIKNAIGAESDYFDFGTLHDFLNNNDNHSLLRRVPNIGRGSIDQLINIINNFIENNDIVESLTTENLGPTQENHLIKKIDEKINKSISSDQAKSLKGISIGFFANNSMDLDVRTRNCLIEAETNNSLERFFENLYDLYVAPSSIKSLLLNLPNFGKHSQTRLNIALKNLVKDEKLLLNYEKLCNQAPEQLNDYKDIKGLLTKEISQLDSKKIIEVLNFRFLKKKRLTLEEVGIRFDVTRERVRQIESKGLSKLSTSLNMRFTQDQIIEWSRNEFENFFFTKSPFISLKMATKILKEEDEPTYNNLFISTNSKSLENFLNNYFSFNSRFEGWFANDEINLQNEELHQILSLDEALEKSRWPIKTSEIASVCNLPEGVIINQVFLSNQLDLYEYADDNYIKYIKIPNSKAIRLALNSHNKALSFGEIQNYLQETFNRRASIRIISAALNYMPDAIMVGRDRYSRYTTLNSLNLSDENTSNLKKFVYDFLMKRQEYISASIIFNEMNNQIESFKFNNVLSSYVLFEICKLDDIFISKRGSMLGLASGSFKGKFKPLTIEIIDLMQKLNRPMTASEITKELSSTRVLVEAAVHTMIDTNIHGIFEKRVVGYFLTDDKRHLEIDESKFEEYEFDDL